MWMQEQEDNLLEKDVAQVEVPVHEKNYQVRKTVQCHKTNGLASKDGWFNACIGHALGYAWLQRGRNALHQQYWNLRGDLNSTMFFANRSLSTSRV